LYIYVYTCAHMIDATRQVSTDSLINNRKRFANLRVASLTFRLETSMLIKTCWEKL